MKTKLTPDFFDAMLRGKLEKTITGGALGLADIQREKIFGIFQGGKPFEQLTPEERTAIMPVLNLAGVDPRSAYNQFTAGPEAFERGGKFQDSEVFRKSGVFDAERFLEQWAKVQQKMFEEGETSIPGGMKALADGLGKAAESFNAKGWAENASKMAKSFEVIDQSSTKFGDIAESLKKTSQGLEDMGSTIQFEVIEGLSDSMDWLINKIGGAFPGGIGSLPKDDSETIKNSKGNKGESP